MTGTKNKEQRKWLRINESSASTVAVTSQGDTFSGSADAPQADPLGR